MEISQKKKILKIIGIIFIVIIVIITISLYIAEKDFREWVDINIFRKSITEEDIISIDLNTDQNNQVYVYSKYIAILNTAL